MKKPTLIRITTVPLSLDKLLEGQLAFMNEYYNVIAVSADGPELKDVLKREGVKFKAISLTRKITPLKDLIALWNLYKFLRKQNPEIVHTHTPKAGIVGMLAARMAGVPIRIHTVAGLPLMEATGAKRKLLNWVEKKTYACATHVWPNSIGLRDFILKENFTIPSKLEVIANGSSNGISVDYFDPSLFSEAQNTSLKESIGIPKNDFAFIFVGRLVGDKGINELVAAFNNLQKKQANISLVLVGPLETALDPLDSETILTIKTHPKIFSVGYQKDVRPFFAFAKALVFPSYREGFPNVVLQAGAMGLPSIVTDINGCNEIIVPKINGSIIPPKDKAALESAMEAILFETEDWTARCRKHIVDKYRREHVWNTMLDRYRKLEQDLL